MKLIQHSLLLSCFICHVTSFVILPTRQQQGGMHADGALRQHSWHDSDFYNSQNDVTRRPLHDKGRDNAAYPDFQEHFSASLYGRPGWNSSSDSPPATTQPAVSTQPVSQPAVLPQPATQPAAFTVATPVAAVATVPPPAQPDTPPAPTFAATQPALVPPVASIPPPTQQVIQPDPTFAAAPSAQTASAMQQDAIDKRLESLEKNVEEIKLTLNYIAALLERAQK